MRRDRAEDQIDPGSHADYLAVREILPKIRVAKDGRPFTDRLDVPSLNDDNIEAEARELAASFVRERLHHAGFAWLARFSPHSTQRKK